MSGINMSGNNAGNLDRSSIADGIWDLKYRLKDIDGAGVDATPQETMHRVGKALSMAEKDPAHWEPQFNSVLEDFSFLPAGRIIAGAGTSRRVTLFNCFVMGSIPDSMGGIFDHLREGALTMQQGGGIGYDFSPIRPKGARVVQVGADASGPLSFMDVWDSMCRTIMSAGTRRGAMMATLRCDHPDIEDFIIAKKDAGRLRMFNLSVLVSDAFMSAVENNTDWDLVFEGKVYRTLKARALWDKIMEATYAYAEPGVIFIDRINQRNNLYYCEDINATNPCGEQPLPPYGACLLGSVNLARMITDPFDKKACLNTDHLAKTVRLAVRMMDNVVDISNFPLEEQKQEAIAKRRIGLGVTGLADALVMCGLTYGSRDACVRTEQWMELIQHLAYQTSIELAKEKGAFPLYDAKKYLSGETIKTLPEDIRINIEKHGIRNALLTSIAPTGTISLFADNVSSGLEPVFAFTYKRRVLNADNTARLEDVEDYAYRLFRHMFGEDAPLPECFVTAQELTARAHINMQASVQKYIDASISKTINLPEDISFDDFKDVYRQAFDEGCKGCTTYRPNDVTGAVLTVHADKKQQPSDATKTSDGGTVHQLTAPLERGGSLPGQTYKIDGNHHTNDHAMYITINDVIDDAGRRRPFEMFINTKNPVHFAWTVALTRMVSAVFRRGGDVSFVAEELQAVFDPQGGYWAKLPGEEKTRMVTSVVAHVGAVIMLHLRETGFLPKEETDQVPLPLELAVGDVQTSLSEVPKGSMCPKCQQPSLIRQEGCDTCISCGYSKCG